MALCAFAVLLTQVPAHAHPISISYSQFIVQGETVEAIVRLPMEELDLLMQLDKDLDGTVSATEIEQSRNAIEQYLSARIQLSLDGLNAIGAFGEMKTWKDRDGFLFLDIPISYRVSKAIEAVSLQVDVLTDVVSVHKNLAEIKVGGRSEEFVFENRYTGAVSGGGFWKTVRSFVLLGIEHIFTGYDHILFLLGLLLVANGFPNLVKIVTSFTVAHSITLAAATLGVVQPVAWTIEAAIALSIAYIGFENLFVKDIRYRWKITFLFGLIHGFGFANILREMHLPRSGLAASLFSFNFGVEIGQVVIVSFMFPLLRYVERTRYRLVVIRIASVLILGMGLIWFYQRVI